MHEWLNDDDTRKWREKMDSRISGITAGIVLLGLGSVANAELIFADDFELRSAVISDYTFVADAASPPNNEIFPEGSYSMTEFPTLVHDGVNALGYGDHTTGSGVMMAVNGSDFSGDVVWTGSFVFAANSLIEFSVWVSTWDSLARDLAELSLNING